MCFYSLFFINIFFCCELFFLTFSHVCQICVAEVLIIHFCRYCHLGFYHHISAKVRSILGVNSISWSIFVLCLLRVHSISGSNPIYVSPKMMGGQLYLWIHCQFCLSQYYLLYVYRSHIFYFSSAILISLE